MFVVGLQDILKSKLFENRNIVLCMESAASYFGMTTEWGIPINLYTDDTNIISSEYIKCIYVDSMNGIDVVEVNGIKVTSAEQTICDLIEHDRSAQSIMESLNYYYENCDNTHKLEEYIKKSGISYDKFQEYLRDAEEYYYE